MDLFKDLENRPFLLAPMAGITNSAYRRVLREMNCGVMITELVSANGLAYASEKTKELLRFHESERPLGMQLFGSDPKVLAEGAKYVQSCKADFVDLNFGCPVKKVVKKGAGSAVLKDLKNLQAILQAVKKAVDIPVTIKIRSGWDENSKCAGEVVKIAADEGVLWAVLHGRTRSQLYGGKADWDYISTVASKSTIPVIGNGDIFDAETAVDRLKNSGCKAVMIGRACMKNPWIFEQSMELLNSNRNPAKPNQLEFLKQLQGELSKDYEERTVLLQMRKLASWVAAGRPGASVARRKLGESKCLSETMQVVEDLFS